MNTELEVEDCCRICLAINVDGEYLSLFEASGKPSPTGKLYETAFGLALTTSTWSRLPRYLCSSCDLQMRLFLKLKKKAHNTIKRLESFFLVSNNEQTPGSIEVRPEELEDEELLYEKVGYEEEHPSAKQNEKADYAQIYQQFVSNTEYALNQQETDKSPERDLGHMTEFYEEVSLEVVAYSPNGEGDSLTTEKSNHASIDHMKNMVAPDEKNQCKKKEKLSVRCFICSKRFAQRDELLQHRRDVHDNKFSCPECPKHFQTAEALGVHARLHSQQLEYYCDQCDRYFNQKVHYNYHMNRHSNLRQFKCDHCGKFFLSKSDLNAHVRLHKGERPFHCEICGKNFMTLQHLKMHRYSHTASKTCECPICNQKFTSPNTLRQHRSTIHDLDRQHSCQWCNKRFRRKHHLVSHYKVHTNKKQQLPVPPTEGTHKDKPLQYEDDILFIAQEVIIPEANTTALSTCRQMFSQLECDIITETTQPQRL